MSSAISYIAISRNRILSSILILRPLSVSNLNLNAVAFLGTSIISIIKNVTDPSFVEVLTLYFYVFSYRQHGHLIKSKSDQFSSVTDSSHYSSPRLFSISSIQALHI